MSTANLSNLGLTKVISGIITDEQNRSVKNAIILLIGKDGQVDTTDSFGRFFLIDSVGRNKSSETINIKCKGFLDTTLSFKIDFNSLQLNLPGVILKKTPSKTNKQLCEQGDANACYAYAAELQRSCPESDGQARIGCIMKVEIWRSVGDHYNEMLQARKDSGIQSKTYKEAKRKWSDAKIMVQNMENSF
ncbi:MAG TPA: hypothetical protein VNZ49_15320 [Bacteroidia bacterium]|nr:hypothetical protein [Bacteroidia bacterium]